VLLVFGNLLSGAGLAFFEDTIAAYIVLLAVLLLRPQGLFGGAALKKV